MARARRMERIVGQSGWSCGKDEEDGEKARTDRMGKTVRMDRMERRKDGKGREDGQTGQDGRTERWSE
jgi:hypothetical protein